MNSRERQLLTCLLVLVAAFASVVGIRQFRTWGKRLDRTEHQLELHAIEAEALLTEADLWKARSAWLAAAQPRYESEPETTQNLLDESVKRAMEKGLQVMDRQYQEPGNHEYWRQFGVTLVVRGTLPQVFGWIYELQDPQLFQVIPYLKITPVKDDAALVQCSMQLWRWYTQPGKS